MTMWKEPLRALSGGVLWLDDSTSVDEVLADLADGWRTAHVRVDADATKESIIAAIGEALDFPDWAGHNLDALYDLLTDLSWLDQQPDIALAVERSAAATTASIDGWQQIVQVLLDATAWWQPHPQCLIAMLR